jgi:hypothetical protein
MMFPVTDGQRVSSATAMALRWNLLTGEIGLANDQPDPAVIYRRCLKNASALPAQLRRRLAALTIHQGKLLARMGSPVTGPTQSERGDLVTELVCLDLRVGQGKLLWTLSEEDLSTEGPPWSFEGTPVVVDATAYAVLYRRLPEPEYGLVAVDAESGIIHWQRSIGAARPGGGLINRVSHLLLTSGRGRLSRPTDQGDPGVVAGWAAVVGREL